MATVSPLYQVTAPIGPGAVESLVQSSHSSAISYHNAMSDSALAATRTSSFAAALRKLAKQSFDPLVGGETVQQHCPSLSYQGIHSNSITKTPNPSYHNPMVSIGGQCDPFG